MTERALTNGMARTRAQSRSEARARESKPIRANQESLAVAPKSTQPRPRKRKEVNNDEPLAKKVKRQEATAPTQSSASRSGPMRGKAIEVERPTHKATTTTRTPSSIIRRIDQLITKYGDLPLSDVGLYSPNEPTPETVLAHLLNALLSSARISHTIAKRALQGLIEQGYHDLNTLRVSTWKERVILLDEAGYARYDFKTATELGKLGTFLKNKYESDITKILPSGSDPASNHESLRDCLKDIKGIGPLGLEILISTLQMIWPPLCPFIASRDLKVAEQIGLGKDVNAIYRWLGEDPEKMARLSAALAKIRLDKHVREFL